MTRRSPIGLCAVFLSIAIGLLSAGDALGVPATGTWVEQGRFETLVYDGQMLPLFPAGHRVTDFVVPTVNAAGETSFFVEIRGDSSYDALLTTSGGGELRTVVKEGDPAVGYPAGFVHESFSRQLSFKHFLTNSGNNLYQSLVVNDEEEIRDALYTQSPSGETRLLVGSGDVPPDAPHRARVHSIDVWGASRTGKFVFNANLETIGHTGQITGNAVWRGDVSGNLELVAKSGQAMTGLPAGVAFEMSEDNYSYITINDNGRTGFLAKMDKSGDDDVMVLADPGMPARVVLYDDQRIGARGEHVVGTFMPPFIGTSPDSQLVLARGTVRGFLGNPELTNVLMSVGGTPQVLLGEGGVAPGLPAGTHIEHIGSFEIQPDDTTLISLRLRGEGMTAFNDETIWSMTPSGEVTGLIGEGTELANVPGVFLGRLNGFPSNFGIPIRVDGGFVVTSYLHVKGNDFLHDDEGLVFVDDLGIPSLIAYERDVIPVGDALRQLRNPELRDSHLAGLGVAPNGFMAFSTADAIMVMRVPEPPAMALLLVVGVVLMGGWRRPFRAR